MDRKEEMKLRKEMVADLERAAFDKEMMDFIDARWERLYDWEPDEQQKGIPIVIKTLLIGAMGCFSDSGSYDGTNERLIRAYTDFMLEYNRKVQREVKKSAN